MLLTIGMFITPRVIRSVVLNASGPDPLKYVLVDLTGATSVGSFMLVMTLPIAEACFQTDCVTYHNTCSIVSMNCAVSLAVPNVKNISLYPLVDARNVLFVVARALLANPNFFQVFFPFFVIVNTLDFIGIMLIEHYPCSSTLLAIGCSQNIYRCKT